MIDHDAAEKLRTTLSDTQLKAMSQPDAESGHSMELVEYISQAGFRLVDEMVGVVR
jgi:hypothetical protein